MAKDALDAGVDGTYPYFPRYSDGTPAWSDTPPPAGATLPPGVAPMPRGIKYQRTLDGRVYEIDMTPTGPGGVPINPPKLPVGG